MNLQSAIAHLWNLIISLVSAANFYSNLIIAIFTAAAALIACLQLWQEIRGPAVKLFFSDYLAYIGPAYLSTLASSAPDVAIFFDFDMTFLNGSPKVGVVTRLSLELIEPSSERGSSVEEANRIRYRFDESEAANAPLHTLLTINGYSATNQRVKCAVVNSNLVPGDSRPSSFGLISQRLGIRVKYLYKTRTKLLPRTVEHVFDLIPAVTQNQIF